MWKTAKSDYKLQGELRKNPKQAVVPPIDCCGAASVSKSYVQTPNESRDCDSEWRGMDDMTDKAREMAATEDQENSRPDYLEMEGNLDVGTECVKSPRGTTYTDDAALNKEKVNVTSPFSPSSLCPSIKSFGEMESVDEEEQITKYLLRIGAKPEEEELEQQGVECATSPRGTTYADNEAVEKGKGAPDIDALPAKEEVERKSVECDDSPCGTPYADNEAVDERAQMNTEGCLTQYEYEAMQGKKMCPNCRSAQSYNEFVNDRRICPNDECKGRFEYKCPTTFKLKTFEKRMQKSSVRRHKSMEKIREEQTQTREKKRGQSRRQRQLSDKVEATGKGFLERMSDDIAKRKDKLSRLEEIMREHEAKTCTFKPKLCIQRN